MRPTRDEILRVPHARREEDALVAKKRKERKMNSECELCKTRAILREVSRLIDQAPEINSALYDDAVGELLNQVDETISLFQCMCDEERNPE
jgi:hypothetical protein